jgi:uncharacterized protein YndB with AHSA1/START domain
VTGLWIAVGVLAVVLLALVAGSFLLLAMGRLHLDLGWGRSIHRLGPMATRIAAPRELVFEMIAAPYLGRTPSGSGIEVLVRDEDLVVAAHDTRVHFYTARTVEAVDFDPPERIGFTHLTGPVPHAVEDFLLREIDGKTELHYEGEIGVDFFAFGRIAARHWVRPQWERVVREHLEDLRRHAEERASFEANRNAGSRCRS